MMVTLENINSFCRTCLSELSPGAELNIHTTPNVAKWLIVCTSLDFEKNDGFPSSICDNCYTKVKTSYEFRVMCIKSMRELDGVVNVFPKLEIDKLEIEGACADLNSIHWLRLTDKLNDTSSFEHKQENSSPVPDVKTNIVADTALDEQKIDQDVFSGLKLDDSTVYDSAEEKKFLGGGEENADEGRKPKDEDYTMPAYIKTPEIYNCEKCKKKFLKKNRFDAHVRMHDRLKQYPCKLCDKTYKKYSHLKVHMMDVHREHKEEFKCEYEGCDKIFRRKQSLRVHCRIKHSEIKYEPKIFICEECGQTFRNNGALRDHRFKHTGEGYPFKCDQCGKSYVSQRTYRDHLMRHAGIKNFVCPYCGLRKTTKSELHIHINYHTKERQWPCTACPQVFNSSVNLGLHNRVVHKGIRRFKCKYCDQSFGKAETLKHHEMRHTGEKPHGCTICGKRFIQVVALRAHLKTHNKAT